MVLLEVINLKFSEKVKCLEVILEELPRKKKIVGLRK